MIISEAAAATAEAAIAGDRRSPWYVEVFLAFGGWIAGLLAAGAIFAFVAAIFSDFKSPQAAAFVVLLIGFLFVAAGTFIGRKRKNEFGRHFAIAGIAAGLTAASFGFAYLAWDWLGAYYGAEGVNAQRRIGAAGLATAAALGAVGFVVASAVKDAILTFLTTLAWFGVVCMSAAVLHGDDAVPAGLLEAIPSAAALVGLLLFTRPLGRSVAAAAGAALMIGPMFFFENLRFGFGLLGFEPAAPSRWNEVLFALAVVYCLWTLRGRFPAPALVASAIILLAGVYLLPDAGAVAIIILLAGLAASHRGLTAVGVVALAWFIGRFYHDLSLTLLQKSAILSGLGVATLIGALVGRKFLSGSPRSRPAARPATAARRDVLGTLAFGVLLLGSLVFINRSVIALEAAFKDSRVIYLPLGPADPRSIIQGDYMILNFRETIFPPIESMTALPPNGEVFLKLDESDVAAFSRIARPGDQPATDEIRVDYVKTSDTSIRYCATEFFFQEGDAEAFGAARFAVVKVAGDGRARLAALADENRMLIDPGTKAE